MNFVEDVLIFSFRLCLGGNRLFLMQFSSVERSGQRHRQFETAKNAHFTIREVF